MRPGQPSFGAIILAGGAGRRLGGADKPGLQVGGSTLAAIVVSAAVAAGARQVVLVGPARPEIVPLTSRLPGGLTVLREDPPGRGPVAALRCGLSGLRLPRAAVLAADLPFLAADHLQALRAAVDPRPADPAGTADPGRLADAEPGAPVGAVFTDPEGQPQWLAGCWRTGMLRSAIERYSGSSLHGVMAPLDPVLVRYDGADGQPAPWVDCDTPGDLDLVRRIMSSGRQ